MFEGRGLFIDKENNRYKKYIEFLFFKIGEWQPLLDFSYVAITKVQGAQKLNSARTMGNSVTLKFDMYCVFLCLDKKQKVMVRKTKNKQEALTLAQGVSDYLSIDLINYIKED